MLEYTSTTSSMFSAHLGITCCALRNEDKNGLVRLVTRKGHIPKESGGCQHKSGHNWNIIR